MDPSADETLLVLGKDKLADQCEIEFEKRRRVTIVAFRTYKRFNSFRRALGFVANENHVRGPLRATLDAWLMRDALTCVGMAKEANYDVAIYSDNDKTSLVFTPR